MIAIVGVLLIPYGELKRKQARASLDWPVAAGRIVTSEVTSSTDEEGTTYSADTGMTRTALWHVIHVEKPSRCRTTLRK